MNSLSAEAAELIQRVRRSWIARYRPESQSTDWGQTLAMYGLLKSLSVSFDEPTYDYLRTWVHFHLNEQVHVNYFCGSWSFGILYPELVKFFPEVRLQLQSTAERIYDFIEHKALRNGTGLLLHNIDLPNIYIDTIYYGVVPYAKLGQFLQRDWMEAALLQIELALDRLRDGVKSFYIHCEVNASGDRSEGSWARGNGWVMMTCAELLPMLNPNQSSRLLERFESLANALVPYQTTNGLWRTILDDADAYEESSASAMNLFAFRRAKTLGLHLGIKDARFEPLIDRAFKGLSDCVDEDGKFVNSSEGTWPGTREYYKSLSRGEWWWGTGAYLLALSEFVEDKPL